MKPAQRIRLLEERVRCLVRCREIDDSTRFPGRVRRESGDDGRRRGDRRGPDEENGLDVSERGVERRGSREVACNDLGAGGERRLLGPAGERAYAYAGAEQRVHDKPSDPACGTCHQDGARGCHLRNEMSSTGAPSTTIMRSGGAACSPPTLPPPPARE